MLGLDFKWEAGEQWIRWSWSEFSLRLKGQYVQIPAGEVPETEMFWGEPGTTYKFIASVDSRDRSVSIESAKDFKESTEKVVIARNLEASTTTESTEVGGTRRSNPFALPIPALDLCLKCSHLFNILDARGAISVTERVGVIARVRALAVGIAKAWVDQQRGETATGDKPEEEEPVSEKKTKKKGKLSPVEL